jgi:hypothetical protein
MGMENLDNFYYKRGSTYYRLLDKCGVSDIDDPVNFPLCEFFADYNATHDKKIINARDAGNTMAYDMSLAAQEPALWSSSKTKKGGVGYAPMDKYYLSVLEDMYIKTNQEPNEYITSNKNIYEGAGLLLLVGGGGAGGGGDSGGWLDEPSGGGGGGSGAWALVYFRYKQLDGGPDWFTVGFDGGATGGTGSESWGASGKAAYIEYKGARVLWCNGGGGGQGSDTADNTSGGSAGSWDFAPGPGGNDVDWILINDSYLFMLLLDAGNGASGQGSGQGGVGGRANSYSKTIEYIPSTLRAQSLSFSYTGGAGGKKDNSDPGGGGGAASILGNGGNGAGSSSNAGSGGYGAGGGGGSEQRTGGGSGGAPVCAHYGRVYY